MTMAVVAAVQEPYHPVPVVGIMSMAVFSSMLMQR